MKVLTIEDRNDFPGLGLSNEEVIFTSEKDDNPRSLYEIAEEIKNKTDLVKECVIFLNIYLTCSDKGYEWKQSNAGVALLKFLRIMNVNHHVVILAPDTEIQLVKESPGNFIVTAKGATLTQQKYNFKGITEAKLTELSTEKFDSDLEPYILSGFRLPEDELHNWANWWGVVQLTDTHRSIFPDESFRFEDQNNQENNYPLSVTSRLKELRSQEAIYLYGHSPSDFIKATNDLILSDYEKQIRVLNNSINFIEPRLTPSGKDRLKPDHWADMKAHYHKLAVANLSSSSGSAEFYEEEHKMDEIIAGKNQELKELIIKKQETESMITEIKNQKSTRIIDVSGKENIISSVRNNKAALSLNPNKILYIDDQANEGWSDIFQIMLYGNVDPQRFQIISDCSKDVDGIYTLIDERINAFNPTVLFLDLRLKKEVGIHLSVEELSGTQILKRIRFAYPGLPVMMTTASNKVWSYQELIKTGADAFWVKEGIDSRFSASDSIKNYANFLSLIAKLFDRKYTVLNGFAQFVSSMDFSKGWWHEYQEKLRIKKVDIQKNSAELERLLHEVIDNIRFYLHSIHLEYGFRNSDGAVSESYHTSSIINKLGNVVEIINDIREEDYERIDEVTIGVTSMIRNRGDHDGNKIRKARHKASHREYLSSDWNQLEIQIERIKKYLSNAPATIHFLKSK